VVLTGKCGITGLQAPERTMIKKTTGVFEKEKWFTSYSRPASGISFNNYFQFYSEYIP
jgi:hypothetical protein